MHVPPCIRVSAGNGFSSRPLALFAVALVALLAASCGGGRPSPDDAFAESVCSTTLPRAQQLSETYADALRTRPATGPGARDDLLRLSQRGKEIAQKFGFELRTVSVPDTAAGRMAAKFVQAHARFPYEMLADEEHRLHTLPKSLTRRESARALYRLQLTFLGIIVDMARVRGDITTFVPELRQPFETADSCRKLEKFPPKNFPH